MNYVDLGSSYSFPCQVPGPEDPDCGMRLKSTPQDLQTRLKDPKLLERAAEDVRAFVQRERHPVDAGPESDTESESRRRIACWVRQEDPKTLTLTLPTPTLPLPLPLPPIPAQSYP